MAASRTTSISGCRGQFRLQSAAIHRGTNHFKKLSQELRFASPADQPFRVIAGALLPAADQLHPPGLQGRQSCSRRCRSMASREPLADAAEARGQGLCHVRRGQLRRHAADHADRGRPTVQVDNTLIGFFGFGRDPAYFQDADRQSSAERGGQLTNRRRLNASRNAANGCAMPRKVEPTRRCCCLQW